MFFSINLNEELHQKVNKNNKNSSNSSVFGHWLQTKIGFEIDFSSGQLCKVPDKLIYDFETPANGARVVKFSADGQRLASGCPIDGGSTSKAVVMVYYIRTPFILSFIWFSGGISSKTLC